MIGRGSFGNPWLFREAAAAIAGLPIPAPPSRRERFVICTEYVRRLVALYNEKRGLILSRKYLAWFLKGIPARKEICYRAFQAKSLDEVEEIIEIGKAENNAL